MKRNGKHIKLVICKVESFKIFLTGLCIVFFFFRNNNYEQLGKGYNGSF